MNIKGVITGDIVKSGDILPHQRPALLDAMQAIAHDLEILSPLKMELFRGDSFQIAFEDPSQALTAAVLVRAGLKCKTRGDIRKPWDARIAVGVGRVSYEAENIAVSDGEVFQLSGHGLDGIGKRRLVVKTGWENVNAEFEVSTAFADDIISGWSFSQAQAVYPALLYNNSQKDIAQQLNKSAQNISKLLAAAKESLIMDYLERFHFVITENLRK